MKYIQIIPNKKRGRFGHQLGQFFVGMILAKQLPNCLYIPSTFTNKAEKWNDIFNFNIHKEETTEYNIKKIVKTDILKKNNLNKNWNINLTNWNMKY